MMGHSGGGRRLLEGMMRIALAPPEQQQAVQEAEVDAILAEMEARAHRYQPCEVRVSDCVYRPGEALVDDWD